MIVFIHRHVLYDDFTVLCISSCLYRLSQELLGSTLCAFERVVSAPLGQLLTFLENAQRPSRTVCGLRGVERGIKSRDRQPNWWTG